MKRRSIIATDDLEIGSVVTVLRNRRTVFHFGMEQPESDYLKGTVLKVVAINLPYLLVEAADPQRGRASLSVDVRNHEFLAIDAHYAELVWKCCDSNGTAKPDDSEIDF